MSEVRSNKAWRLECEDLRAQLTTTKQLLTDADEMIRSRVDHEFSCPRHRDDHDCTCGLSDLKHRLKEFLR